MPTEAPLKDPTTGQFVARKENDLPIATVLNQEAGKRAEKEKADKAKPPEKSTEAVLDENVNHVIEDFVGFDRAKEADEIKKSKEEAQRKEAEKKAKAKVKPKPEKPPVRSDEPVPLDVERIASAAAEGVARVLKPKDEKKPEPEKAEQKVAGPEARHLEVLDRMEKLWPEEYKNAGKRYKEAQGKIAAYQTKWEKDHPGETFDENAEEHADYYNKNDLYEFWDERDYVRAAGNLEAERVKRAEDEQANRQANERLSDLERKEKLREAQGQIAQEQVSTAREFWKHVGEDFASIVTDQGQIDHTKLNEWMAAEPVAASHYIAAARDLNLEVSAVYSVMNGLTKYDARNEVHQVMSKFGQEMENALAKKPATEKQDDQGRTFLPYSEYAKVPQVDRETKYWTLSARDIAYHRAKVLAKETADRVKAEEDKLARFAKARGYTPPPGSPTPEVEHNGEHEVEVDEHRGKPQSPSGASESRMATRQAGAKNSQESASNPFFQDL